jgi:hypothetical protein
MAEENMENAGFEKTSLPSGKARVKRAEPTSSAVPSGRLNDNTKGRRAAWQAAVSIRNYCMAARKKNTGKQFETIVLNFLRKHGYPGAESGCSIDIGARHKKAHPFDAGIPGKLAVECKDHAWRANGGVPSAKVSDWNEAMYYFHLLPAKYEQFFFAVKSVNVKGETLMEYYVRRCYHLIPPNVRLFEYDPAAERFAEYTFVPNSGSNIPKITVKIIKSLRSEK